MKRTYLGEEDHGLFTLWHEFEGVDSGWGQGLGHYVMNQDSLYVWVKSLVDFFGPYGSWEGIKGAEVYVLRQNGGLILGLAHKTADRVWLGSEVRRQVEVHRQKSEVPE